MADGKTIEEKVFEFLSADATLMALLATDANGIKAFYISMRSPTGVRYPSVNFEWSGGSSEEKITAEHGMLTFYINQAKDGSEQYKRFTEIRDRIKILLNRNNGTPLTEFTVAPNEGLRVVMILKTMSEFEWDKNQDKNVSLLMFKVTKGEDEDFATDYGTWVCS
jgi:hypothetical protein